MAVYEEAAAIAREHSLPDGWLNDGVEGLLPDKLRPAEGSATFSTRGLHVGVASPQYLFAMKAQAARQETDGDDLRTLARVLGLKTADEALDLVERFYGAERLSAKTQLLLGDIFGG